MKHTTILLLSLILLITSCKKDKAPTPSAPAPTTPTMTATQTALVGKWYWDKSENWNSDILGYTMDPSNTPTMAGSYMELKSTLFQNLITQQQSYDAFNHKITGDNIEAWTLVEGPSFPEPMFNESFIGNGSYIKSVTATTLIMANWTGTVKSGTMYYFHK